MHGRREREELERRLAASLRRVSELEAALAEERTVDPLTRLQTLGPFSQRLDLEVERARRHQRPVSVAILDVDGFRALNAHHGRATGDRLLAAVGGALARYTRAVDATCRASADEFVVLLPEADERAANQCLERVQLELEATRVDPIECVSASVGIASYRRGESSEELMARAGQMMDEARRLGGGRTVSCGEGGNESERSAAHGGEAPEDVTGGLAMALLERDRYTGEHSESLVDMAVGVARELGLDAQEQDRVRMGALLHDIGKVAIPDHVLHKDGPLDDDEWLLMREHPVIGERILRAIPGLGGVARIVRHEHESWDGSGYPDRLMGDQIPIGSRIILACDAYHAMTSDRPYRKAMSHQDAVRELHASAGRQFDPRVTECLIGVLYGMRQASPTA